MDVRTKSPVELLSIALDGAPHNLDRRPIADRIQAIEVLRARLDQEEQQIAFSMRHTGSTWAAIGEMWGITRQAAHERFHDSAGLIDKLDAALHRQVKP